MPKCDCLIQVPDSISPQAIIFDTAIILDQVHLPLSILGELFWYWPSSRQSSVQSLTSSRLLSPCLHSGSFSFALPLHDHHQRHLHLLAALHRLLLTQNLLRLSSRWFPICHVQTIIQSQHTAHDESRIDHSATQAVLQHDHTHNANLSSSCEIRGWLYKRIWHPSVNRATTGARRTI